ncbi:MAG: hypothetical protein J6U58_01415 [Bacteroidaceae bacterium]|nr:hypothetical protein [Bacteroidaceae bacterium]
MKRHILLLLIAFIGINAMAQELSSDAIDKTIDIRGSKVYVDGNKLDKYSAAACFSSLNGVDRSEDYLKFRTGYKTGLGLTVGGASLLVTGFVTTIGGIFELNDAIFGVGVFSMVSGTLSFLAGIPTLCVYKARLNRLEKKHNASLSIGTAPGGLSMAISF